MPNNIELAISAALMTDDSQNTPNIAHVLSAYVQVAGFTDLRPSFAISKCASSSFCPDCSSSAGCTKCSDAVVISAFERALEKAATSTHTPGASEASKLVSRVRRQYWRGILIAAGNKEDELTQMLLEAERKEMGEEGMGFLSLDSAPAATAPIAQTELVLSKKSKKKKRRSSKDLSVTSPSSSPASSASEPAPVAAGPPETLTLGGAGYNPTLTRAALVSPRLKALSISRSTTCAAADGPAPLRTSQRYVTGEGYKTYYPCPCCGGGSVRAKQMMKVLGIDEDEDGSDGGEVVHEGEEREAEYRESLSAKKRVSRKRKTSSTSSAKGEEGERKKKMRQVKRRVRIGNEKHGLVPAFDPFAPSSSRVSL
jgi:hypothetical protein